MRNLVISEKFPNVNNLIFSIATSFVTKIRSRFNNQSIDDLQFEKDYFAKESYYR